MKDLMIDLRGQRVELTAVSYLRGWIAYQGGDYFEFRPDGTGGWLLSQSEEWDYHDPSHVVGRGATLQAAAEDFAHSITRQLGTRSGPPSTTYGRDLVAASIDDLVPVLGAATRLGYRDGAPAWQRARATRSPPCSGWRVGPACNRCSSAKRTWPGDSTA